MVKTFDAAGRLATYTAYDDNAQRDYFYVYDTAGRVDTLTDGVWVGTLGEGTVDEAIDGTFTGARRTGG